MSQPSTQAFYDFTCLLTFLNIFGLASYRWTPQGFKTSTKLWAWSILLTVLVPAADFYVPMYYERQNSETSGSLIIDTLKELGGAIFFLETSASYGFAIFYRNEVAKYLNELLVASQGSLMVNKQHKKWLVMIELATFLLFLILYGLNNYYTYGLSYPSGILLHVTYCVTFSTTFLYVIEFCFIVMILKERTTFIYRKLALLYENFEHSKRRNYLLGLLPVSLENTFFNELDRIKDLYHDLWECIQRFTSLFSPLIILFVIRIMVFFIFITYAAITQSLKYNEKSEIHLVLLLSFVVQILAVVYSCSITESQIVEFTVQIMQEPISFTALGLFSINTHLLVTIAGVWCSYMVILIQFRSMESGM